MKWQDKLTKKQMNHVKESIDGPITLQRVKSNCLAQEDNRFPCWDCVEIASRLGIQLDLRAFHHHELRI